MVLPLTIYGNPVLRQKGQPVREFGPDLHQLIDDMLATMHDRSGVGLAAQQIGHARQLAVIDITAITDRPSGMTVHGQPVAWADYMPLILINPQIEGTKTKDLSNEGCLSFPGLRCDIARMRRVHVTTQTPAGGTFSFEATGLLSIAIQHEVDHLQGKLFIDYLTVEERRGIREKLSKIERGLPLNES